MARSWSSKDEHSEMNNNIQFSQCSALRKGGYLLVKNQPSKIVEMSSSKTGKHGGCKVHILALDVFTKKKHVLSASSTDVMSVPAVAKQESSLVSVGDTEVALLDPVKHVTRHVPVPAGDLGEGLRGLADRNDAVLITTVRCMNQEQIVSFRIDKRK